MRLSAFFATAGLLVAVTSISCSTGDVDTGERAGSGTASSEAARTTCQLTIDQRTALQNVNGVSGYTMVDIGVEGARLRTDKAALVVSPTGEQPIVVPACAYDEAKTLLQNVASRTPTSAAPTASATPASRSEFGLGEKAQTQSGSTIVVYSYDAPVAATNRFSQPKAGHMFVVIDVEGCAGVDGEDFNPFDFQLQMPDNTRIQTASSGVREPALHQTTLTKGDCVRGFVPYEIPESTKPKTINYSGNDPKTFRPILVKWLVP